MAALSGGSSKRCPSKGAREFLLSDAYFVITSVSSQHQDSSFVGLIRGNI